MRFRYPQPDTEQDFEVFCLRVLRRHWSCSTLELYGKRGEEQAGVDIVDVGGGTPLRAAQCKHREPKKKLGLADIRAEVEKAKAFPQRLDFYLIITTGARTTATQEAVIAINKEHRDAGIFEVQVVGWEWVEELVDRHPDLKDELYPVSSGSVRPLLEQQLQGTARILEMLSRMAPVADASVDQHDRDLDEARDLLDRGEHQVARALLHRLKRQSWDGLSAHQKFRLTTNLAASHMPGHDKEIVAALLLEGATYEPDTERSRTNRAIAFELRGNQQAAYEAACRAYELHPDSARALAARIRTSPETVTWAETNGAIPEPLAEDADVAIAMAQRALSVGAFDEAAEWARRASAPAATHRAYALILEGRALFEGEVRSASTYLQGRPVLPRPDRMTRAVAALSEAVEIATGSQPMLAAEALVRRAEARRLLGQDDDARRDVMEAERLAPNEPFVLVASCERRVELEDWTGAVDSARRAVGAQGGSRALYFLGRALWMRNGPGDRPEATSTFRSLVSGEETPFQIEIVENTLRALRFLDRAAEAWALLDEVSGSFAAGTVATLRAMFAVSTEDRDRANGEADQILRDGASMLAVSDRRRLARVLVWLRRDGDAFALLQSLHTPGQFSDDTHDLLDCAHRLGRHDIVLRVSRALREAGVRDRRLLRNELSLLERYAPNTAVDVLQAALAENPDDRAARLELSLLGLHLGRPELVASDPSGLPSSSEASPQIARRVVEVLQRGMRSDRAIVFAYEVLRQHFEDPDAHRAYVAAMLWRDRDVDPVAVDEVEAGTAVRFEDEGTGTERWMVIASAADVRPDVGEESPLAPLAKALIGRHRGERITVTKGHAQDRVVRVIDILDKHVHRFQDCMSQWQVRFPNEPDFEMIRVARGDQTGDLKLEPIIKVLDARRESIAQLDEMYRANPMPIHVLARAHGSDIEAFAHVLASENLEIRCSGGADEEWHRALQDLDGCRAVVLDLTALLAVDWLDLRSLLASWPVELLVPHGVMDHLRRRAAELRRSGPRRAMSAAGGGRVSATEEGPAEHAAQMEHFDGLIRCIEERCTVVDCPELASVDPAKREALIKYVGEGSAQAIVLAAQEERILWTDEFIVALIGRQNFVIRHAWTQAVLHARQANGAVEPVEITRRVAKLLAARYVGTRFDVSTFVEGAVLADWNPMQFPLKQALDQMIGDGPRFRPTIAFALNAIVGFCVSAGTVEARTMIVVAILERIARKPGGIDAIRALEQALPNAFGLNVVRAAEARNIVRSWLTATGLPLS